MSGKVRYLIQRGDRFHARIVVPKRLRPIVGKVELSAPLGADRRQALRKLPAVVASIQDKIAAAERRYLRSSPEKTKVARPRPLDDLQIARIHLAEGLSTDEFFRDSDRRYASSGFVDERQVRALRDVVAGKADNDEIAQAIGVALEVFRRRGNHCHEAGSVEWRRLARVLASAELAVLNHIILRDDGFPDPDLPEALRPVDAKPEDAVAATRVRDIFDGYRRELAAAGKATDAAHRWSPIIEDLITFLGHDSARRITRRDMLRWKDSLLEKLAPKTVRDGYLATVKAAFNWAVDNDLLASNPAAGVKVRLARRNFAREKGFTDKEALAILTAAAHYKRPKKERPEMAAAKRWAPLLCAFSGARIAEITQLRGEDVRHEHGVDYLRITPDAGTVKSGLFRDVPLHPQLIELGFLDYVKTRGTGPLFYRSGERVGRAHPSRVVADRVGKWIRQLAVVGAGVQPNHGWRHRFKTQGRALGVDSRVLDCLQGHAPATAGEAYGDVTLKTRLAAIEKFPRYAIGTGITGEDGDADD